MSASCTFATCLIAVFSLSVAIQFRPLDIRAVFERVGTNPNCPRNISHQVVNRKAGTSEFVVEHQKILIEQVQCSSNGRLRITSFTSNRQPPSYGVDIYRNLLSDGAPFFKGKDSIPRICGKYKRTTDLVYFFVRTNAEVRLSWTKGVRVLQPATNYMLYVEPKRVCVFKSNIQPTPRPKAKRACFPGDATVLVDGGGTKRMDEIAVGDSVLVAPDTYSQVFMFTHRNARFETEFVELQVQSGAVLQVTPGHFIYANGRLMTARNVQIGDALTLGDGTKSDVVSAKRVTKRGIFNPQTVHGNIVANGVTASTFTEAVEPVVALTLMSPLRCLFRAYQLYSSAFKSIFASLH